MSDDDRAIDDLDDDLDNDLDDDLGLDADAGAAVAVSGGFDDDEFVEEDDELPADIAEAVDRLSELGDEQLEAGDWQEAVSSWQQALNALPEPADSWEAAEWLYGSLADAYWSGGSYLEAERAAQQGIAVGTGNAFIWLRLGQAQFELGRLDEAVESLTSAYRLEGEEIFEDEDLKFLDLLRERGLPGA